MPGSAFLVAQGENGLVPSPRISQVQQPGWAARSPWGWGCSGLGLFVAGGAWGCKVPGAMESLGLGVLGAGGARGSGCSGLRGPWG